jgi:hypothetical protein
MSEIESPAAKAARKGKLPYQPISHTFDGVTVDETGPVPRPILDAILRAEEKKRNG